MGRAGETAGESMRERALGGGGSEYLVNESVARDDAYAVEPPQVRCAHHFATVARSGCTHIHTYTNGFRDTHVQKQMQMHA